jgi:hypothetical protein
MATRTESKIISRIDKIAKKGKTNKLEFSNYIYELVDKEKYSLLLFILDKYYQLNLINLETVKEVIDISWEKILSYSNSEILTRIKRILDQNDVYQVGNNIYTNDNILLGKIEEFNETSNNFRYYVKNKEYAKLKKEFKTFIRIIHLDGSFEIIDIEIENISELQNYINRFYIAIKKLKKEEIDEDL